MADRTPARLIRAAGAVVWRPAAGGVQVALIHRRRYGGDWTLPKGKSEPGEHVLLTAVREVAEETGIEVTLGRPLGRYRYHSGGRPKQVSYWAGRCRSAPAAFQPNAEVDDLAWLPVADAVERVSYPGDAEMLGAFAAGPAQTVPLILLRHAEAGSKAGWPGNDLDRPLDSRGRRTAQQLARLLHCFGRCRVISSQAERCVATVRPYAALAGPRIETEPLFTAGEHGADPAAADRAAADRAAAIAADGVPTLICTHRENLPLLLKAASSRLEARPPEGPAVGKGGFWVLHRARRALASAEQHCPAEPYQDLGQDQDQELGQDR